MINAELLPPVVLQRKAVVYVRQSTQAQVQMNLESQRRQYDLVGEASKVDLIAEVQGTFELLVLVIVRGFRIAPSQVWVIPVQFLRRLAVWIKPPRVKCMINCRTATFDCPNQLISALERPLGYTKFNSRRKCVGVCGGI